MKETLMKKRDHNEMSELEEARGPSEVKDYKDLDKAVQSFRYDVILKTG